MGITIEDICAECNYEVFIYYYISLADPHPGCDAIDEIMGSCFKTGQEVLDWLSGDNTCKENAGICFPQVNYAERIRYIEKQ